MPERLADPGGERIVGPATFETKVDAEGWLAMNHAATTEGRWRPNLTRKSGRVSFEEYSELWLQRRELKPRTRRDYEKLLVDLQEEVGRRELQVLGR